MNMARDWRIWVGAGLLLAACQPKPAVDQRPPVTLPPLLDQNSAEFNLAKKSYDAECGKCHQTQPGNNHKGPQLDRIYGAQAAQLRDYTRYSSALKQSGWRWDAATLDRYLTHPEQALPNTKMLYDGLADAKQRQAIIAYLSTLRAPDVPRPAP